MRQYLRHMQRILIGLLFTGLFHGAIHAQSRFAIHAYQNGMQHMRTSQWPEAMKDLQLAVKRSPDYSAAWLQLGHLHARLGQCNQGILAFAKAAESSPRAARFAQGKLAMTCGLYQEALKAYDAYLALPNLPEGFMKEAERQRRNAHFSVDAIKVAGNQVIEPLSDSVNRQDANYFPSVSGNGMAMTYTARNHQGEAQSHEDIWLATHQADNQWRSHRLKGFVNSGGNEGAATLSGDQSMIIFTACDRESGYGSCDLYLAKAIGRHRADSSHAWSYVYGKPVNLGPGINTAQWESQPSLAADGHSLFFIRAAKQGRGDANIWISYWDGKTFAKAQPLDSQINTPYAESTPFMHADGKSLFFASEGHVGMGNLDLFKSVLQADGSWGEVINLGSPINGPEDDFGMAVNPNGAIAYMSRGKLGHEPATSQGAIAIHRFELPASLVASPVHWVVIHAMDALSGKPLPQATWTLYQHDGFSYNASSAHLGASFEISLPSSAFMGLNVMAQGYNLASLQFDMPDHLDFDVIHDSVFLDPLIESSHFILENILFAYDESTLLPSSIEEIDHVADWLRANPQVIIRLEGHTDNVGSHVYNMTLSQSRADVVKEALVQRGITANRLMSQGFAEDQPLESNETADGRSKNRRTEIFILSTANGR